MSPDVVGSGGAPDEQPKENPETSPDQMNPKKVIIVTGIVGSGKSFVAANLAEYLEGYTILKTDGLRPTVPNPTSYLTQEERDNVYLEMFERAQKQIAQGLGVILDGTFNEDMRQLAEKVFGADNICYVHVTTSPDAERDVARRMITRKEEHLKEKTGAVTATYNIREENMEIYKHPRPATNVFHFDNSERLRVNPTTNELDQSDKDQRFAELIRELEAYGKFREV